MTWIAVLGVVVSVACVVWLVITNRSARIERLQELSDTFSGIRWVVVAFAAVPALLCVVMLVGGDAIGSIIAGASSLISVALAIGVRHDYRETLRRRVRMSLSS